VFYEFEILIKIRKYDIVQKINPVVYISKWMNKDLHEINILMKKASKEIKNKEIPKAEDTYHELIEIYNNRLNSDLRKKTIDHISSVYNELLVQRILTQLNDIDKQIELEKKSEARDMYGKVQELYKELPGSCKGKVSEPCKIIFSKLAA